MKKNYTNKFTNSVIQYRPYQYINEKIRKVFVTNEANIYHDTSFLNVLLYDVKELDPVNNLDIVSDSEKAVDFSSYKYNLRYSQTYLSDNKITEANLAENASILKEQITGTYVLQRLSNTNKLPSADEATFVENLDKITKTLENPVFDFLVMTPSLHVTFADKFDSAKTNQTAVGSYKGFDIFLADTLSNGDAQGVVNVKLTSILLYSQKLNNDGVSYFDNEDNYSKVQTVALNLGLIFNYKPTAVVYTGVVA